MPTDPKLETCHGVSVDRWEQPRAYGQRTGPWPLCRSKVPVSRTENWNITLFDAIVG